MNCDTALDWLMDEIEKAANEMDYLIDKGVKSSRSIEIQERLDVLSFLYRLVRDQKV